MRASFSTVARSSGIGLTREKPVRNSMPGSLGDMRTPFHFSLRASLGGRKKISRAPDQSSFLALCASEGKQDQSGFFFIVARQVIKILFLGENVGLRFFFFAGIAEKDDGSIDIGSEFGASRSIRGIGLAFPALLGEGGDEGEG